MKKKKIVLAGLLGIMMLFSLAGCGKNKKIRLGTGGVGGNYYTYGTTIAQLLSADDENLDFDVKTTAGSAANLRLLSKGFLDIAIVQSDTLKDAYQGTGDFEKSGAYTGYAAIAGLYSEVCQVIVPADSSIDSISDLYGKKVSLGAEESGVLKNAKQILDVYGMDESMIKAEYLDFADSAAAMEAGKIDAFFCTASAPTTAVTELSSSIDIRVISLEDKYIDRLVNMNEGYIKYHISAGTYRGQDKEVSTIGVKAVLIASTDLDKETVNTILTGLFAHTSDITFGIEGDTTLDLKYATEGIPIPFHDGAASYYDSQGIDVETGAVDSESKNNNPQND